jgi:hypothetical protein
MDGVEQNHPDLLYHKLDEDGDLVRASSDSRLEVQDKDEVNGLPFHVIEVRIAYLRYKQKTQERIARESNRQLWVARSQWQSKVDDLWGQYCALRYDTKDPGEQGVRGKGENRHAGQELFDRWRGMYRDTIGIAKYRFYRAQEEEKEICMKLVVLLQARRHILLRETVD